jgi:hypothetical protein
MKDVEDTVVETYQGLTILLTKCGYYAENGPAVQFGYTDTIEEIREEINDYFEGDEHGPLNGFFNGGNA